MILNLYNFSVGSYVVAEEWNSNFRVLHDYCVAHAETLVDAYQVLAFPNSDLSDIFTAVRNFPNVADNQPYNGVDVQRNKEYYVRTLGNQQQVKINIPLGMEGECRVIFNLPQLMTSNPPILVEYNGVIVAPRDTSANCYVNTGFYSYYNPGMYYVMIHEQNGKAQVKLVSTGV